MKAFITEGFIQSIDHFSVCVSKCMYMCVTDVTFLAFTFPSVLQGKQVTKFCLHFSM